MTYVRGCVHLCAQQVTDAVTNAEKQRKLPMGELFEDVYDEMPSRLRGQMEEMTKHVEAHEDKYPVGDFGS